MHEEAQAEVLYLYRPDPARMPDIALEQPDAPARSAQNALGAC